jgi:hypothetical protein
MKRAFSVALATAFTALPALAGNLNLPQIGVENKTTGKLPQITDTAKAQAGQAAGSQDTPQGTLDIFIAAMKDLNDDPGLPIYSAASRLMLANVDATDDQMKLVADTYDSCGQPETVMDGGVATLLYPVDARTCPPVFMFEEDGLWVMDLVTSAGVIRFNMDSEWHFSDGIPESYAFAFADWSLDEQGYPYETRGETGSRLDPSTVARDEAGSRKRGDRGY